MPTIPTLHTDRGGTSSPHHLPPPRQLTRTTRLPPPSSSSRSFQADDDPFSTHRDSIASELRSGADRPHRRPQGPRAPPREVEHLPGLSSDDDDEVPRRMETGLPPSMASMTPHEFNDSLNRAIAQQSGAPFYGQVHPSRQVRAEVGLDESTLDPVEVAQIQAAMQEDTEDDATEDDAAVDEGDTGDTEEAEVEGDTADEGAMELDNSFDMTGLKEIGNLASWTVSTCKPGSGVEALRNDDTNLFWQSDGPQPHHLNIHFSRLVCILSIRIYLDFEADESYTPTKLLFLAGTGYHDLIPFAQLQTPEPKGWIDVDLSNVGGGSQGNELRAFLVQLRVVENHQNGKDTHVRGLKIYARDERQGHNEGLRLNDRLSLGDGKKAVLERIKADNDGGHLLEEPDWMGEAELR